MERAFSREKREAEGDAAKQPNKVLLNPRMDRIKEGRIRKIKKGASGL